MADTRTRRDFFKDSLAGSALLLGTAAGCTSLPGFAQSAPSPEGTADCAYWDMVPASSPEAATGGM